MTKHAAFDGKGFFNQEHAEAYDRRNSGLKPISNCLHFLTELVLARLPDKARILCVGIGTGAEVLPLAAVRPDWTFVGVDPSPDMLAVGRHRLAEAGVLSRCELYQGYVDDAPEEQFDAVICLFVAHFIQLEDRPAFYRAIYDRLAPGGMFVSAEISDDLDAPEAAAKLEDWKQVQARMGATPESLATLGETLRNVLGVVSPAITTDLWREAGFSLPVPFFQAFMVCGWHAQRPDR